MNGGPNGSRDDAEDDRDGTGDGTGDDSAGRFEFGPEREPVDGSSTDAGTERDSRTDAETVRRADDSRIEVDLPDGHEASEPPESDPGFDPSESGPEPGPGAVRNWSLLAVALAVAAFATAAFTFATHDDPAPVAGVAGLGVAFAALAVLPRFGRPTLLEGLAAGWLEHRRYVRFSIGLFAFGTVVGVVLLLAGVNLLELIAELLEEGLFPELEDGEFQLTATFFIRNNSQPFLLSIVGALSLGLLTAFLMVFNGVIVGNVAAAVGGEIGVGYIVAGIAPHGIFELPALFIAAGVGFRLLYRFGERVFGSRDAFVTKPYLYRTLAFAVFGWLLLVLAAFVEAYVTPELLELLFADQFAGTAEPGPSFP
ncbi:hypothetical protein CHINAEXTREME_05205 [Halobiforma lacisalsi AJ5]|uniref:Stage II sporulation protein M n=1 Tax=Natronobacterium lacisalsi AJ5 TaxID=358396 RepID=M0LLS9_NATLA|nr:stage II sporulation protein M [Halobiforma lacisalsi]APW97204.1 hypothetical protein CHINAEXTREME_05205 [Halobiforma lacisalsi AJ5]EMA34038.1 hypothetical protein C445_08472 [Halobiforma lacisalsi AJ5]